MKAQNYSNYKRYYIPHHFVFYPIVLLLIVLAIRFGMKQPEQREIWFFLAGLVALVGWLSFLVRQHYAMMVQDRVVLFEVRYRYFTLTGQRLEPLEAQLSKGQLFSLRFASDEEFPALVQRAVKEGLSGDAIKREVKHWRADHMRV